MAETISFDNYQLYLEKMVARLSGKKFNILTRSGNKSLKFCNRELDGVPFSKNGQVSLALKPGSCIAWDLNSEEVKIDFDPQGDILLSRTFKNGKEKIMLITTGPI